MALVTRSDWSLSISQATVQFFILLGLFVDVTVLQIMHLDLPGGEGCLATQAQAIRTMGQKSCMQISLNFQQKVIASDLIKLGGSLQERVAPTD
ncbi:hypothetical protein [Spirosoma litoris]